MDGFKKFQRYGNFFLKFSSEVEKCILWGSIQVLPNQISEQSFCTFEDITRQSQKTQGFCVADFATLSDEIRSRSKIFSLLIWINEPCVRKFEGLERSKLLGISQTREFRAKLHKR